MKKKNYGFKGNVPKQRVEIQQQYLPNGDVIDIPARVQHVHNGWRYSDTLGWKRIQDYVPHTLLNSLLNRIGLNGVV